MLDGSILLITLHKNYAGAIRREGCGTWRVIIVEGRDDDNGCSKNYVDWNPYSKRLLSSVDDSLRIHRYRESVPNPE